MKGRVKRSTAIVIALLIVSGGFLGLGTGFAAAEESPPPEGWIITQEERDAFVSLYFDVFVHGTVALNSTPGTYPEWPHEAQMSLIEDLLDAILTYNETTAEFLDPAIAGPRLGLSSLETPLIDATGQPVTQDTILSIYRGLFRNLIFHRETFYERLHDLGDAMETDIREGAGNLTEPVEPLPSQEDAADPIREGIALDAIGQWVGPTTDYAIPDRILPGGSEMVDLFHDISEPEFVWPDMTPPAVDITAPIFDLPAVPPAEIPPFPEIEIPPVPPAGAITVEPTPPSGVTLVTGDAGSPFRAVPLAQWHTPGFQLPLADLTRFLSTSPDVDPEGLLDLLLSLAMQTSETATTIVGPIEIFPEIAGPLQAMEADAAAVAAALLPLDLASLARHERLDVPPELQALVAQALDLPNDPALAPVTQRAVYAGRINEQGFEGAWGQPVLVDATGDDEPDFVVLMRAEVTADPGSPLTEPTDAARQSATLRVQALRPATDHASADALASTLDMLPPEERAQAQAILDLYPKEIAPEPVDVQGPGFGVIVPLPRADLPARPDTDLVTGPADENATNNLPPGVPTFLLELGFYDPQTLAPMAYEVNASHGITDLEIVLERADLAITTRTTAPSGQYMLFAALLDDDGNASRVLRVEGGGAPRVLHATLDASPAQGRASLDTRTLGVLGTLGDLSVLGAAQEDDTLVTVALSNTNGPLAPALLTLDGAKLHMETLSGASLNASTQTSHGVEDTYTHREIGYAFAPATMDVELTSSGLDAHLSSAHRDLTLTFADIEQGAARASVWADVVDAGRQLSIAFEAGGAFRLSSDVFAGSIAAVAASSPDAARLRPSTANSFYVRSDTAAVSLHGVKAATFVPTGLTPGNDDTVPSYALDLVRDVETPFLLDADQGSGSTVLSLANLPVGTSFELGPGGFTIGSAGVISSATGQFRRIVNGNDTLLDVTLTDLNGSVSASAAGASTQITLQPLPGQGARLGSVHLAGSDFVLPNGTRIFERENVATTVNHMLANATTAGTFYSATLLNTVYEAADDVQGITAALTPLGGRLDLALRLPGNLCQTMGRGATFMRICLSNVPDLIRLSWTLAGGANEPQPSVTYEALGRESKRVIQEITFTIAASSLRIDFGIRKLPENVTLGFLPSGFQIITSSRIERIGVLVALRGRNGWMTLGGEVKDLPTNLTFAWGPDSFDLDIGADTLGAQNIGAIDVFLSVPGASLDIDIHDFPPSRFEWGEGYLQAGPKPGFAIGIIDVKLLASPLEFRVLTEQLPGIGATWEGSSGTFSLDGALSSINVLLNVGTTLHAELAIEDVPAFDLAWSDASFDVAMDDTIGSISFTFIAAPLDLYFSARGIPALHASWDDEGGTFGTDQTFDSVILKVIVTDIVSLNFLLADVAPLDVAWHADGLSLVPKVIDPSTPLIGTLTIGVTTTPFKLNISALDIPGIIARWAGDEGSLSTTGPLGRFEVRAVADLTGVVVNGTSQNVGIDFLFLLRGIKSFSTTWGPDGFVLEAADPSDAGRIGDEIRTTLKITSGATVLFDMDVRATGVPGITVSQGLTSGLETLGELESLSVALRIDTIVALSLVVEGVAPAHLSWDTDGLTLVPLTGTSDGTLVKSLVLHFFLDFKKLGLAGGGSLPVSGAGAPPFPPSLTLDINAAKIPGIEASFGADGLIQTTGKLESFLLLLKLPGVLDVLFLTRDFPALEQRWDAKRLSIDLDGDRIGSILLDVKVPIIPLNVTFIAAGVPGLTIDLAPDSTSGVPAGDYASQTVGNALGVVGLAGPLDRILLSIDLRNGAFRTFFVLDHAEPLAASWNGTSISILPTGSGRNSCGILCGLTLAVLTDDTIPVLGKITFMVNAARLPGVTIDLGDTEELSIGTASELGLLKVLLSKPGPLQVGDLVLGENITLRVEIRDVSALQLRANATELSVDPDGASAVGLIDITLNVAKPWLPPDVLAGIAGVLVHKDMTPEKYNALIAPSALSLAIKLVGVPGAHVAWGQDGFRAGTEGPLGQLSVDFKLGDIVSLHLGVYDVPKLDIESTGRSLSVDTYGGQIGSILVSFSSVDLGATLTASRVPGVEVAWDGASGSFSTNAELGLIQLAVGIGHAERFGIPGLSGKVNLTTGIQNAAPMSISWDMVGNSLQVDTGEGEIGKLFLDFLALDIRAQLDISGIPTTTFDWGDGAFSMSSPAGIDSIHVRLAKGSPVFSIPYGSQDHISLYLRPNLGVYGVDLTVTGLRGVTLATDTQAEAERLTLQFVDDKSIEVRLDLEARLGPSGLGLVAEDVWLRAEAAVLLLALPATMRFTFGPEGVTWDGRAADGGEPAARIQADVKLAIIIGSDTTAYSKLRSPYWPFHSLTPGGYGSRDGLTLNALVDLDQKALVAKLRIYNVLPLQASILTSSDGAVPGFHATTGTQDGLGLVDIRVRLITPVSAAHGIPVLDTTAFLYLSNIPSEVTLSSSYEGGAPHVTLDSSVPIDRVFVGLRFDGNMYPATDVDVVGESVLVRDSTATLNDLLAQGVDQLFGTSSARRYAIDAAGFALFVILEDIPTHVTFSWGRGGDSYGEGTGDATLNTPAFSYSASAPTLDITVHVDIAQVWKKVARTALKAASDAGKLPDDLQWVGDVAGYEVWGHATLVVVDVPTGGLSIREEEGTWLPKIIIEPVGGTPLTRAFIDFEFRVGERKSTSGDVGFSVAGFGLRVEYDAGFQWDIGVESLTVLVEDLRYLEIELSYKADVKIDGHLQFGFRAGVGFSAWARIALLVDIDFLSFHEELELFEIGIPEFRISAYIDPGFIVVPWQADHADVGVDLGILGSYGVRVSYEYPRFDTTITGAVYGAILGPTQGIDMRSTPGVRAHFAAYLNPKIVTCFGGAVCAPGIPLLPQDWVVLFILADSVGHFIDSISVSEL